MNTLQSFSQGIKYLFFPRVCMGCAEPLSKNELHLCLNCLFTLPYTQFEQQKDNGAIRKMWGRFPFENGSSLLYFTKNTIVQNILHQIKYGNNPELCIFMGVKMGEKLSEIISTQAIDLIVPVPIHPNKERKRGYNQSALLCQGIAQITNTDKQENLLIRKRISDSQTKKTRSERWENVAEEFELNALKYTNKKHILLIDDVMTTGATLEACALVLQQLPNIKISFATLAIAEI